MASRMASVAWTWEFRRWNVSVADSPKCAKSPMARHQAANQLSETFAVRRRFSRRLTSSRRFRSAATAELWLNLHRFNGFDVERFADSLDAADGLPASHQDSDPHRRRRWTDQSNALSLRNAPPFLRPLLKRTAGKPGKIRHTPRMPAASLLILRLWPKARAGFG